MTSVRPTFEPTPCITHQFQVDTLRSEENIWTAILSCPAGFPVDIFEAATSQLIDHPEYNSTLILRSETLEEADFDFPEVTPTFEGLRKTRFIHRKLLARRPGRDAPLEQYCTLYSSQEGSLAADTLVLTPIVDPGSALPYYHPSVHHLAFRYVHSQPPELRIEVLPLPETATDINGRLYRTCLALLETLHRYGWGAVTNYKKRVQHDCLVPREAYQDLYLIMRERHKHLVATWQEVTDPLKHVFEDIGIATFLMLLWKDTFPSEDTTTASDSSLTEPWKAWPRPPSGFLDFGCGNGLLTHILIAEGYLGFGIDLRARTSWTHYPQTTQDALRVHSFEPIPEAHPPSESYLKPGVFIIGNHADELTPWLPVVSTIYNASGYLSIPCCAWAFDTKYDRASTPLYDTSSDDFTESLNLGGDGTNKSSYSMYRIWLASLSLHCGWEVECETLRIPSTRNWALIGRRRLQVPSHQEAMMNANTILSDVKMRGVFKARKPEGKAGDH
ncbi:DUF1613-domain-containing protein [Crepidotus variabilis]|uniref:tRNA (uracil-O(2)-)-methyltransferase n=1 Tax=Crepidotus variabilis TaxID=179855 RepID=A0A9P6E8C4_9AGAR|nr:DUF1613-domain-containing protein [Crepidotus variabilis]